MQGLRSHLTYANVMSTMAFVLALGGGAAYAANTIFSTDIVDGEVKEADVGTAAVRADEIGQGAVETAELKNDAVTNQKVLNETLVGNDVAANTLKGADIDESTLSSIGGGGPAGGDLTGTYPNPSIRSNAVGGLKVANNSLTGLDIDESTLDVGGFLQAESATGGCPADSQVLTQCAFTAMTLDRPGSLLVNSTSEWHTFNLDDQSGVGSDTDDAERVRGRCRLAVDGAQIGSAVSVGERSTTVPNHQLGRSMALTALSGSLAVGRHTVDLSCTEEDGDLDWSDMNLTAAFVAD